MFVQGWPFLHLLFFLVADSFFLAGSLFGIPRDGRWNRDGVTQGRHPGHEDAGPFDRTLHIQTIPAGRYENPLVADEARTNRKDSR